MSNAIRWTGRAKAFNERWYPCWVEFFGRRKEPVVVSAAGEVRNTITIELDCPSDLMAEGETMIECLRKAGYGRASLAIALPHAAAPEAKS